MFAKINKSGCGGYHGNVKVRIDFFLEKDDPRYSDTLVDVLNEEGEPIGKKLNPFHSHFVYLYPDFTDLDVYRLMEFHAPNFYLAFQNEWDKVLGGMRHGWDVRERVRPVRLDNEKDYQKIKRECERKITLLGELSLSASGEGREFPSTDIDIGDGAADLSSFRIDGSTHVTLGNPANETGTLDTVEIWAQSDMSGTKVGTFSGSGTNYTNRDYESIGDVTSGAKRTFTGLDIDVSSGDFIGAYWTGGRLEYSGAGGSGVYNKYGDQFGAGTQTFDLLDSDAVLALYGTGETGSNNYPVNISCGLTVGASVSYVAGYKRNASSGLTVSPSVTGIRGRNESCSTNLSLASSATFTEGKGVVITTGLGLCVNDRNNYLITIPSDITKDVVDFPFGITENNIPSSFWSVAETDNLILRDVTGSLLYGELVTLDTVNHKLELYVKIPYAFEGISRSFYLSVGEGTSLVGLTGTANAQSVWDENFCYDKETEVLTNAGWKLFKDLSGNELVATLNPETDEIEYQKPTEFISYQYKGKMFQVADSNLIDLLVIPDHNMYVSNRIGDCNWSGYSLQPAKDIFNKNVRYKKDGKWIGKEKKHFTLPSITNGHNYSNQYSRDNSYIEKMLPEIKIDMDVWLEFLGYFISEGCAIYQPDKYKTAIYSVDISQSETANPEIREKIEACLNRLPFKYSKNAAGFTIKSKQLASYLRQFGYSENRYIPLEIKELSSRQLRILFNALMDGDGSKHHPVYFTKSKQLADDVQEILLKMGGAGTVYYHDRGYPIYTVTAHMPLKYGQLKPYIAHKAWSGRTAHNEWVEYDDMVYCVEVPNHVIYVRRNGKAVWSGNCFVSHMNDNPAGDGILDSTSNENHGSKDAAVGAGFPVEVSTPLGGGQLFYSSNNWEKIFIPNTIAINSFALAVRRDIGQISAYVNNAWWDEVGFVINQNTYYTYTFISNTTNNQCYMLFNGADTRTLNAKNLGVNYTVEAFVGSNAAATIDRERIVDRNLVNQMTIGGLDVATRTFWKGIKDEIRISSTARGAGWISFTASNLKNNSTSYSVTETSQTSPSRQVNYSRDSLANLSLTSIVTRTVNYAARIAITNLSLNPIVTRTVNYTRSATTNLSFQAIVTAIKRGWVKVKLKLFKRSVNMYMNNRSVKVKLHKRDIKLKIRRK